MIGVLPKHLRGAFIVLIAVAMGSCGGNDPAGPDDSSLSGRWTGQYLEFPASTFDAVLSLNLIVPTQYRGTLETSKPRSAVVVLNQLASGEGWTLDITFMDSCPGTALGLIRLVSGVLMAEFSVADCRGGAGPTAESFVLSR